MLVPWNRFTAAWPDRGGPVFNPRLLHRRLQGHAHFPFQLQALLGSQGGPAEADLKRGLHRLSSCNIGSDRGLTEYVLPGSLISSLAGRRPGSSAELSCAHNLPCSWQAHEANVSCLLPVHGAAATL